MNGKVLRLGSLGAACWLILVCGVAKPEVSANRTAGCRFAVIEGQVEAGQSFSRSVTSDPGGLKVWFEALPSGWQLRVAAASEAVSGLEQGGRPGEGQRPDSAQLATPPYRSPNPLLFSTDFGFRAQDAVGWNPRHFRYVADRTSYERMLLVYQRYMAGAMPETGVPRTPDAARAERELVRLTTLGMPGELDILDARLEPGTADQTSAAAAVAAHYSSTAHSVAPARDGKAAALGRIVAVRFRVRMRLAATARVTSGVTVAMGACE